MNKRNHQWLICILFCGFLAGMMLMYLCLPKKAFSQQEKRYLAETPTLSWQTLSNGDFSQSVDDYMADHIPGRDFFVGLNAYFDLLTGRQAAKDILPAEDGRLVEAPVQQNDAAVKKNMDIINTFAGSISVPVDLMIVPSAGWAAESSITGLCDPYRDAEIIQTIYDMAGERIRPVDILSVFQETGHPEELYYKTDHHWNSLGAYTAYQAYMQTLGKDYLTQQDYQVETIPGFYGSTYSRSALWLTPGESLELWHGSTQISVTHEESQDAHDGIFFRERLDETDKYTVFLDGNHSLVRLENPENAGKGKLLVIRDSFCNSLGGFLADSYETVVLADLRYYRLPVSALIEQESFDQILICYSIGNFLTDTNIIWLR